MAQKLRPQAETLSGSPQPNFTGYAVAPVIAKRAPTSADTGYPLGQEWVDKTNSNAYILVSVLAGSATWAITGGSSSAVATETGDTGTAIPSSGNINHAGTANQITTAASGSTITYSVPATFIAPGSIAATATITAGTGLSTTVGGVSTGTSGSFVVTSAGFGLVMPVVVSSGAAPGPVACNTRVGSITFTGVSIAAAADLTLTMSNNVIGSVLNRLIYSMSGTTTGSALSVKSITASSGSVAWVVTNGTGATTSTANITFDFIVLN